MGQQVIGCICPEAKTKAIKRKTSPSSRGKSTPTKKSRKSESKSKSRSRSPSKSSRTSSKSRKSRSTSKKSRPIPICVVSNVKRPVEKAKVEKIKKRNKSLTKKTPMNSAKILLNKNKKSIEIKRKISAIKKKSKNRIMLKTKIRSKSKIGKVGKSKKSQSGKKSMTRKNLQKVRKSQSKSPNSHSGKDCGKVSSAWRSRLRPRPLKSQRFPCYVIGCQRCKASNQSNENTSNSSNYYGTQILFNNSNRCQSEFSINKRYYPNDVSFTRDKNIVQIEEEVNETEIHHKESLQVDPTSDKKSNEYNNVETRGDSNLVL